MFAHTTEDEIKYLRELELHGRREVLRGYRNGMYLRSVWNGLDRDRIAAELNRILGKESERDLQTALANVHIASQVSMILDYKPLKDYLAD